ncbi:xanthine dehydrogenase accessory protein XdhC [Duganella qianjiadongensis]|uniref:Xanthine dehydrogenase accessory protein XdhC n=1 Tax=Duganella qianjiadongensis TaxID=2692176 RepID=A0ABW9VJE5_9BURK|nr:xanthine dehydrogenase accessory protein XdhC [Duganella qianjiadongensis]MYM39030.1 xanthine dehydrogenase accessory protein XdhC [Duganella qianjiadongensis]
MNPWLNAAPAGPAVLVTVAIAEGSVPREAGAHMLVTADAQADTIGGGHLELCALEVARGMLREAAPVPQLLRYALGPTLGQCCGGVVYLAYELVDAALAQVLAQLRRHQRSDCWRVSALDGAASTLLLDGEGTVLAPAGAQACIRTLLPAFDYARSTQVLRDDAGRRWLADAVLAPRAHLLLFGAGHVGAAIVRLLGELPCTVSWIDEREDMFPSRVPANVRIEATDTPEALVASAPAGASYLVLTHSHALDQRLSEAIVARAEVGWFGLIGSQTKRVQFERRMAARGLPAERIAAMVCPIGLPGIRSKLPAVIATSVCAQLLMVWETQYASLAGSR